MKNNRQAYRHEEYTHNLSSPSEIVPVVCSIIKPRSVVDVGCGIGTFLKCFKDAGVKTVCGIDGPWTNKDLLLKNLTEKEFIEADLAEPISIREKFDLVVCLEVAEHLKETSADHLINTLTSLGNIILFSAAIPYQGGQNHVNEQWIEYWQTKFSRHDYIFVDVLRKNIWKNEKIQWWYKQNIFLVIKRETADELKFYNNADIYNYVHPELFTKKAKELQMILSGNFGLINYLKLLAKSLLKINSR